MRYTTDFLVLGSGIAGLTFALRAAEHGAVALVTKRGRADSATNFAQGGISAVLDPTDTFDAHVQDTLATGAGLSKPDIVRLCVEGAPARIHELVALGVKFSKAPTAEGTMEFDLAREGGHSARRVIHAGDITGREVERALLAAAEAHPRITIYEQHMGVDLIMLSRFGGPEVCAGAWVLDKHAGVVHTFTARATVLATGGAGKVYLFTSNPDVATGDGVAMAYRAGAEVANMEFYQFHPTALYHPQAKNFLISEALRGEGGVLRLEDGTAFMKRHHPMMDLAPRDVVARAIDFEMKRTGEDCVWLDMTHHQAGFLRQRFPNIYAECMRWGIDLTEKPIPVVPAAHYACGGVTTDADGRTSLPGLWALGEVACTGLHGANRLASNSLLEGLVFGHRALDTVLRDAAAQAITDVPDWDAGQAAPSDEAVVVTHNWDEIRRLMWNYVGIVRTTRRLERAARRIALLQEEIREYYWAHLVTMDLLELRNIATVAELIVACALVRKESRGLHYTLDHLSTDPAFGRDTVLKRGVPARLRA
ncbi:MAG: L-aspartate oxidase [Deltaproteobacteria bacterium]|nr:L-aspartate oxidase [Deltaproteobacteria bacterium]